MKRALLILWVLATPLAAVEPDEILSDPALEARARDLSRGLRCLVCRNESIDESNAALAKDLRVLVRDRLVAGDTDRQVIDYVVARYGEYVLLTPQRSGSNLVLWASGPVLLILAGLMGWAYVRRRRGVGQDDTLSAEEEARLRDILND